MDDAQVGWIAAIIIGGVAGWLAEQFMKSEMGILMNIVLGVIGAAVASAILSFFGVHLGGWIGYLIAGFIGAALLIWIVRAVQGHTPASLRLSGHHARARNVRFRVKNGTSKCCHVRYHPKRIFSTAGSR